MARKISHRGVIGTEYQLVPGYLESTRRVPGYSGTRVRVPGTGYPYPGTGTDTGYKVVAGGGTHPLELDYCCKYPYHHHESSAVRCLVYITRSKYRV